MAYLFNFIHVSVLHPPGQKKSTRSVCANKKINDAHCIPIHNTRSERNARKNVHDGEFQMEFSEMTAMSNIPSTLIIYTSKENWEFGIERREKKSNGKIMTVYIALNGLVGRIFYAKWRIKNNWTHKSSESEKKERVKKWMNERIGHSGRKTAYLSRIHYYWQMATCKLMTILEQTHIHWSGEKEGDTYEKKIGTQ